MRPTRAARDVCDGRALLQLPAELVVGLRLRLHAVAEFGQLHLRQPLLDLRLDGVELRKLCRARVLVADDVVAELGLDRLGGHLALLQLASGPGRIRGRTDAGLAKSRSPPLAPDPGSFEWALASSSKLPPALILAISSLASASPSTRMWRARISLPALAACCLELVVLGAHVGLGDRVLLLEVLEQFADQDALTGEFHLRLVLGVAAPVRGASASCSKISRRTISSRTCVSSSGVIGWPWRGGLLHQRIDARLRHRLAVDDRDVLRLHRERGAESGGDQQHGGSAGRGENLFIGWDLSTECGKTVRCGAVPRAFRPSADGSQPFGRVESRGDGGCQLSPGARASIASAWMPRAISEAAAS